MTDNNQPPKYEYSKPEPVPGYTPPSYGRQAQQQAPQPPAYSPAAQPAAPSGTPEPIAYHQPREGKAARPGYADDIDFTIYGHDMQCVEVTLDPGETVVAESGSLMYMDNGIQMSTKMSDGSKKGSGMMGSIVGAAKRSLAGERIFLTFYTNAGNRRAKVAFAAPYPGCIVPLDLSMLGSVMCHKDGFLCGAKGISVGVGFTKRLSAGMFGGEGYILQKIEGDGMAFIHSGGSIIQKDLAPGEIVYIDTGSVVAFQKSMDFNISMIKGVSNMLFGGEDLFLSTIKGPGKVWIQSMPYYRLVANIHATMLSTRSRREVKQQKKLNKMAG